VSSKPTVSMNETAPMASRGGMVGIYSVYPADDRTQRDLNNDFYTASFFRFQQH